MATITIIDTNNDTTSKLAQLKARGIECVIRYISSNTSNPKVITPTEAKAIAAAGLKLALVYETRGGADNFSHNDITADQGQRDGAFARTFVPGIGAPDNAIIYFAVDTDCSETQYERLVRPYLVAAKGALQGKYRVGVYACGFVCDHALQEQLVDATWLTQSMGFNQSRTFCDSGRWTLLQGPETTMEGLSIDSNEAHGNDFGAFVPFQAVPVVAVQGQVAPPLGLPGLQSIDLPRLQRDLSSLGQAAGAFSQVAGKLAGAVPPAQLPPQLQPLNQSITHLAEIAATLSQFASALSGQAPAGDTTESPQILSPIDKVLGGPALVGLKTPIAIFGYLVLWILQAVGAAGPATGDKASTTSSVLTALFGALGAAGATAKLDRAFQAIAGIAGTVQKLPAVPPASPNAGGT